MKFQQTVTLFSWRHPPSTFSGVTARSLFDQTARGAARVVRYVDQVEGNTLGNVRQVASKGATAASRSLENIGMAEKEAAQPLREYIGGSVRQTGAQAGQVAGKSAAAGVKTLENMSEAETEALWGALQRANYFFGLPYTTQEHKEYLKAANLPWGHSPPIHPAGSQPGPQQGSQQGSRELPPPAAAIAPVAPAAPTQAQINADWMNYWNGRGERPAKGTVYQP